MDIRVVDDTVIVFDLDDTLYNELDFLKSAFQSIALALEPNNWKLLYSRMLSLYRSNDNVFEFIANVYNLELEILIDMYRNHKPNIQLFDGVLDVFKAIKSKNGKIGIVTDGRSKTQRAKIDSLGILDYLDSIIVSEEIGSDKPCLANFQAIENSIAGKSYYYVADNLKKDFIAPNTLGWYSIALIDNGMNIHYDSHRHMSVQHLPQEFIMDFKDFKIL